MSKQSESDKRPQRWPWLLRRFRRFVPGYVAKRFHRVLLTNSSQFPDIVSGLPIVFVLNHPSWWDPMIGILISERFPNYEHFAPIDAQMLEKYRVFKQLGFYPLDRGSMKGIAQFLRATLNILSRDSHAVWITAQGQFCDVRQRPLNLEPGVGHIAARMSRGLIVPIALEYTFWNESRPNAFIAIGEAIDVTNHAGNSAKQWLANIEKQLTITLDNLNTEVQQREAKRFTSLMEGSSGVGGLYDIFRRLRAWSVGQSFNQSHESQPG